VKIIDIIDKEENGWVCLLFADSKESDLSVVEGLPVDKVLLAGSILYSGSGDIAFLNSSGEWTWRE